MADIVSAKSITKTFPGVKALDDVDVSLKSGRIYSLVGENGAGKSTLVKILSGVYKCDKGKIFVDGIEAHYNAMEALLKYKIACVHQEPALIPEMTIAENFFLEIENRFYRGGFISHRLMKEMVRGILKEFNVDVDVDRKTKDLRPDEKRMVELARALYYEPKLLILDEITAPLTEDGVKLVFAHMKDLKESGKTVLFISHRLEEVLKVSDEAIVLKDGRLVGTASGKKINRDQIIEMMIGEKSTKLTFPDKASNIKEKKIFEVRNLKGKGINVDFEVREGEILALAGLRGQGMENVLRMIYGVMARESGDFYLNGEKIDVKGPKEAIDRGIIYISDDRDMEELWPNQSVMENIIIPSFNKYSKFGILNESGLNQLAKDNARRFNIKAPSLGALIMQLSGGNRQKVVFGKWICKNPKVILASCPAIGLDLATKAEVYKILRDLANKGIAVITYLSELSEVVNLPDRILVMRNGAVIEELKGDEITEENVLRAYFKEDST
ncbi:MAG: sugar ABC transporter ATP-binding protein [Candidatus Bathyarchaeia archaeon]|nr:sugar ABC transporter ATP-binding protein [Candidatus Bathyarchaeota archaeon]